MADYHVRAGQARAKAFTSETQSSAAKALVEKRGAGYMAAIGKRGAKTFYKRYRWAPAGQSGWAILTRDTREVVKTVGKAPDFMKDCSCVLPDQSCPACRAAARRSSKEAAGA